MGVINCFLRQRAEASSREMNIWEVLTSKIFPAVDYNDTGFSFETTSFNPKKIEGAWGLKLTSVRHLVSDIPDCIIEKMGFFKKIQVYNGSGKDYYIC